MSETIRQESVLKKYLKKYWLALTVSVVFATLSNYLNLRLPQFLEILVDEIIIEQNFDMITEFILELALIFFFGGICDLIRTLITKYVSTNIIYNIRNDMFRSIQRQSYTFFDMNRTGNLMSKTTHDVNMIRNFLANQFQSLIKNLITFIIIFIFVWQQSWQMALLFLSLTPPLYILMVWYRKRIRPASYAMYKAKGELVSTLQENIAGVRVVKAFGRQEMEMDKYLKDNDEFIEKNKDVIKLQTLYGPLSEFFTMGGSALLVFLGGYLVVNNLLSIGAVVGAFVYFSLVYDPIRNVVNFFNRLAANKAALDRVNEVLENKSEIEVKQEPIDPSRVLGDLYLRLLKDEEIIKQINAYLGIEVEDRSALSPESIQKLKKFEEKKILPRGVKLSAINSLGFKGKHPMLLTSDNIIGSVADRMAQLVRNEKFRIEFKAKGQEKVKRGKKKSFDPISFIMQYLDHLTQNDDLMEECYERLERYTDLDVNELHKDPDQALFAYIEHFAEFESEQERVTEIQQLLYSPSKKQHSQIAKKYDKLLVEKGIIEPSRKDTILGNEMVTSDALSFLRTEKEVIEKELKKAERERREKYGDEMEEDEQEEPPEVEPIKINTKFEDVSWSPVKPVEIKGHVVFDNVSFAYYGQNNEKLRYTLKHINLDIQPGETIAFLGATGSGKSTLINLIPRFYDPTNGYLYVDGVDVREYDLDAYRRQIGIVAQETFLFSRTLKDNISYGKKRVPMEDIVAVSKIASIHDFIMSLPDQYDTVIGERGQTLSGGQKQRVAIARALLLDPRILILDDSLSAVDVDTEYEIQQALDHLFEGRTTFIITQRLSTIRNCDRIVVLDDGQIAEEGTHEELLELNGIYTKIYSTMFKKQKDQAKQKDPQAEMKKRELKALKRRQQGSIVKQESEKISILSQRQRKKRKETEERMHSDYK